ncbi:MAG: DUF2304 domain-containing protein [Acutalibacteraceae bacterium]
MSPALRILLIVGAVVTCVFVLRKMRRSQMLMADSIFWIIMSLLLVVISIFPGIAGMVSVWIGVESPSNFVFLVMIFILLVKLFSLSAQVSQLKTKLRTMVEEYAVRAAEQPQEEAKTQEQADKD